MLGQFLIKRIYATTKIRVSYRFMSWKRGVPIFTEKQKKITKLITTPGNVQVIYKLPDALQKFENNLSLKLDSLRASFEGKLLRIQIWLGINTVIYLILTIKLYIDVLTHEQQSDKKRNR
uniref:Uncharacterized protein n=1 Tax=Meloidogyne enterolobii TaxID=390850 RepID=A0A6V7UHG3_MELEN|nr:unnamed protein product [Meloidogyne enterolobii]